MKESVMRVCPKRLTMILQTSLPKQQTLLFEPVTTSLNIFFFLLAFQNIRPKPRWGEGGHHVATGCDGSSVGSLWGV